MLAASTPAAAPPNNGLAGGSLDDLRRDATRTQQAQRSALDLDDGRLQTDRGRPAIDDQRDFSPRSASTASAVVEVMRPEELAPGRGERAAETGDEPGAETSAACAARSCRGRR